MCETVKRSRKSRMKKRPDEWEQMKVEIARELGLWDTVQSFGWGGLSAADSGRLGGVLAARKKALLDRHIEEVREQLDDIRAAAEYSELSDSEARAAAERLALGGVVSVSEPLSYEPDTPEDDAATLRGVLR